MFCYHHQVISGITFLSIVCPFVDKNQHFAVHETEKLYQLWKLYFIKLNTKTWHTKLWNKKFNNTKNKIKSANFFLWFFMIFSFAFVEKCFLKHFKYTHIKIGELLLCMLVDCCCSKTNFNASTYMEEGCINALLYFGSQGMISFHFHFNATKIYKRNTITTTA